MSICSRHQIRDPSCELCSVEIDDWIASLSSPEDDARYLLDTARARGARIKKGKHTEKVLLELLTPLLAKAPR